MQRNLLVDENIRNANLGRRCTFGRIYITMRKESNRRRGTITRNETVKERRLNGRHKAFTKVINKPVSPLSRHHR